MESNYTGVFGKGKMKVLEQNGNFFCQSYNTIVCGIIRGKLKRYWGGYSKTTMAHIGQFVVDYNIHTIKTGKGKKINWLGVKTWDALPVEESPIRVLV